MGQLKRIYPIAAKPGIQRDGTMFDKDYYSDGVWARWQRGLPRKMGGYNQISDAFSGPVRGAYMSSQSGQNNIFAGSAAVLEMESINNTGFGGGIIDRTPAGFPVSADNIWQFDEAYDATSGFRSMLAHGAPNMQIDSTVQTPVYYGATFDSTALVTTGQSVSGGVLSLHPYTLLLDNAGKVLWNVPNLLTDYTNTGSGNAFIDSSKLIKGVPTRGGGGYSPAGLIWSLENIIRVTFTGSPVVFSFDILAESSLLSTSAVVEYDGLYFWPTRDRFQLYNGVVRELPNNMSLNFFFDNYNKAYPQKIWGTKIPRFGEICWFFPMGTATECNWMLIYNTRENTWYDTPMDTGRSAGYHSKTFLYPVWFDNAVQDDGKYQLWQHEIGVDKVVNSTSQAILSSYTTNGISWCATGVGDQWVGQDRWVELSRIEPDFVQTGDMTVTITGQKYAQSGENGEGDIFTFSPDTGKIDMKLQQRELYLTFQSNTVGGNYEAGSTLLHLDEGDSRQ